MSITAVRTYAPRPPGSEKITCTEVTFDSSYPTGGEPTTFGDLGLSNVVFAICQIKVPGGTATAACDYDVTNQKIVAYNTTAQVGSGVDLSALVVKVLAFGT